MPKNWNKVTPCPNTNKYIIKKKPVEDKKAFLERYSTEKETCDGVFDFRQEMVNYCCNNVTVLRKCVLKFREDFLNLTELDPFESVTIVAPCEKYLKTFVLQEEEVAIISTHGYQRNKKTSIQATQWLEWENMSADGRIQHGRTRKEAKLEGILWMVLMSRKRKRTDIMNVFFMDTWIVQEKKTKFSLEASSLKKATRSGRNGRITWKPRIQGGG